MFEIETKGFSGPLDLLCELVESGNLQFAQIRLSEIVLLYTAYLRKKEEFHLREILHFLSLTSRLLHDKAVSLLPSQSVEEPWEEGEDIPVERLVEAYRPYRKAASLLEKQLEERQRCFPRSSSEGALFFDAGDLYLLGMLWWDLFEQYNQRKSQIPEDLFEDFEDSWEGVPAAIPEEGQVESRMEELRQILEKGGSLSFVELLKEHKSKGFVVLTLLALLEMCRKEEICMAQKEIFGTIHVSSA